MAGREKSEILKDLKPRQRKYVKGLTEGKNKKQAALDAGYSVSMAENAAAKIEAPNVRIAFQKLVAASIPENKLIQRLAEGLDATRPVVMRDGDAVVIEERPDFKERREHVVTITKMSGRYTDRKELEVDDKRNPNELSDSDLMSKALQLTEALRAVN